MSNAPLQLMMPEKTGAADEAQAGLYRGVEMGRNLQHGMAPSSRVNDACGAIGMTPLPDDPEID